ncbi:MAG: enoyl-CoA hydratase/isomerase family protein [Flavobacteriales bacterium]|nr:MAG: enoyl-CoA hydratase/isomerase family protein [Flavobacteriales bacterium]
MEQGHVKSTIENQIGIIEFGHPLSNSLPGNILNKLALTITELGENEKCKVILLKSAGDRAFCAGASFDELVAIKDLEEGRIFFSGFAKVINACRTARKIIVARIQGKAVGGGVGIAASADYAFATKNSAIKLSELAVGIGPFVVGPAVERKIGLSAMSELAIDATQWRSAEWAQNKGLYSSISESPEIMDKKINELLQKLANSNPDAMRELKKVFWAGTEDWSELLARRAEISGRLVLSEFTRNAIHAFKKK